MSKKRGLGRGLGDLGLSELLSDMQAASVATAVPAQAPVFSEANDAIKNSDSEKQETRLREVPVDKIRSGRYQPRKTFEQEGLEELAQSIRSQGVIQPIILRRMNDGYEIIAGERRWRAAQLAGLPQIPAIIRDIPDEAAMAMALIENIQRRDLNSIEEAAALQRLISEFHLTHQEVAEAVGKSRTLVTNLLRLLKLNPDVRALVEKGHLEMGHARALLTLDSLQQSEVANHVVARALSVRQTEELVRNLQQGTKKTMQVKQDPNITSLQNELSEKLGAKVNIRHTSKGKGKLVVHYHSLDELEGILEKFE
ncbi:MAG: ParB/RepB/Spo0J family partition protein [Coxiellaceae bacterium]|nr:ParB/RepB/Spo0J family partition protein [Coxiellaceae bacterium]